MLVSVYVAIALVTLVCLQKTWRLLKARVFNALSDPLILLHRPPASWLEGQFWLFANPKVSRNNLAKWTQEFGRTFVYQKTGRHDLRLITTDLDAISYILTQPNLYGKPPLNRSIFAHPDVVHPSFQNFASPHLNRKIITPAFSGRSLQAMTAIFSAEAEALRDRWLAAVDGGVGGEKQFDVLPDIIKTTFDVVSNACFDFSPNFSGSGGKAELSEEATDQRKLFDGLHFLAEPISNDSLSWRRTFTSMIPNGGYLFPSKVVAKMNAHLDEVERVAMKMIENKKQTIIAEGQDRVSGGDDPRIKPLLTLLVNANMTGPPEKRLGPLQVLDQLGSVMIAGGDTIGVAIAWTLHLLALHPSIQTDLRTALLELNRPSDDQALLEALTECPLLEAVVKESLRFCPPVHGLVRGALVDDVIPLSEPITIPGTGEIINGVEIRKGSCIHIPIEGLNFSTDLWGPDAGTFNPGRWLPNPQTGPSPLVSGQRHPGLERIMTFSFGAYACLGYRMAVQEMRMMLDMLVRNFVFKPVHGVEIGRYQALFTMPCVEEDQDGEREKWRAPGEDGTSPCLPLVVEKYED